MFRNPTLVRQLDIMSATFRDARNAGRRNTGRQTEKRSIGGSGNPELATTLLASRFGT